MTLINLLILSLTLNTVNNRLLESLNDKDREEIVCRDGRMQNWGIHCAADYSISFTKAKTSLFNNNVILEGNVYDGTPIPYVKVDVIKIKNDSCLIINSTETNLAGEFKLTIYDNKADYLQFSFVRFKGYSINLK